MDRDRTDEDQATVLVVDDSPEIVAVLGALLQPHAQVLTAGSGEQALRVLQRRRVDLVLLDLVLGGIDGLETLRRIRDDPRLDDTRVMVVTGTAIGTAALELEEQALRIGAVDFVRKPLRSGVLMPRIHNQLEAQRGQRRLRALNLRLQREVHEQRRSGEAIAAIGMRALGNLAGTRDPETGSHLARTQLYLKALCADLRQHPRLGGDITPEFVDQLLKSAPLHDIGKVGVPDHILLKPGPLTDDEWVSMRQHPLIGAEALRRAHDESPGTACGYLAMAHDIVRHHHERWDGAGYPDGLAGETIPLAARLMAIADVYDALISRRPYKAPFPPAEAARQIVRGSGSHFDPELVAAFVRQRSEFEAIAASHRDPAPDAVPAAAAGGPGPAGGPAPVPVAQPEAQSAPESAFQSLAA